MDKTEEERELFRIIGLIEEECARAKKPYFERLMRLRETRATPPAAMVFTDHTGDLKIEPIDWKDFYAEDPDQDER